MAKRPTIRTVEDGPNQSDVLNYNFQSIKEKFLTLMSRDGATPNAMQGNLDLADANWSNINQVIVENVTFIDEDINGLLFGENRTLELQDLVLTTGDIIFYNQNLDLLVELEPAANGSMLKVNSDGHPFWGVDEDDDTDTDTVGVTIQEDGVTIATNVVEIDFTTASGGPHITESATGTGPGGGNEVDIDLENGINGDLFYDDANNDNNIVADGSIGNYSATNRVDLVTDLGFTQVELDASSFLTVQASMTVAYSGGPSGFEQEGEVTVSIRGREPDDSTATFSQGTNSGSGNFSPKTATRTTVIPAGTRYIDFESVVTPGISVTATPTARLRRIYRT